MARVCLEQHNYVCVPTAEQIAFTMTCLFCCLTKTLSMFGKGFYFLIFCSKVWSLIGSILPLLV